MSGENKNTHKKKEPERTDYKEFSDSCFSKSICSSTDCTGLIPALPSSEAELEAYEEMYQFCLSDATTLPHSSRKCPQDSISHNTASSWPCRLRVRDRRDDDRSHCPPPEE